MPAKTSVTRSEASHRPVGRSGDMRAYMETWQLASHRYRLRVPGLHPDTSCHR